MYRNNAKYQHYASDLMRIVNLKFLHRNFPLRFKFNFYVLNLGGGGGDLV